MARPDRKLKSGADPHEFTGEERRKGGLAKAEKQREQRLTFEQRVARKLEERADEVIEVILAAGADDWRALIALIHEAYGKPRQRVEVTGDDGGPIEHEHRGVSLADIIDVARRAGVEP